MTISNCRIWKRTATSRDTNPRRGNPVAPGFRMERSNTMASHIPPCCGIYSGAVFGRLDAHELWDAYKRKYHKTGNWGGRVHVSNLLTVLKELGVDMIYALQRGIVAPKGTPRPIIDYWAGVFKKAAADPSFLKQMDAKGTGVEYIGPDGYRKWANKMFKEHEDIAVKIGLWKR